MKTLPLRAALGASLLAALVPVACAQIAGLKDYKIGSESGGTGGQSGGTAGTGGSGEPGGAAGQSGSASGGSAGQGGSPTSGGSAGQGGSPTSGGSAGQGGSPTTSSTGGSGGSAVMFCMPGTSMPCYSGPAGTENNAPCKAGMIFCNPEGTAYGPCTGEVLPATEVCGSAADENCDGLSASCTGGYLWAWTAMGGTSYVFGVAVDSAGNVFATGTFDGMVDFGGGVLMSDGLEDVFVLKLDPAGKLLWAKRFGDSDYQFGTSLATDSAGNVVVTGYLAGAIDFGGGTLVSGGSEDIFVAKLDGDGNHVWSKVYGDAADQNGHAIATDSAGNVVFTGKFSGTADFGNGPLTSAGDEDVFVVKLSAGGAHQWSKRFGDAAKQFAYGVAIDGANDVFLTGQFSGSVDFGNGPLTSAGLDDLFVAKLGAANGSYVWANRAGDAMYNQHGISVVTDPAGDAILTGRFKGSMNLGGGNLVAGTSNDIFAAKLSGGGSHVWSKRFGDSVEQFGQAAAADGLGNVLLTGYFSGVVNFGGGALTATNGPDIYLVKLDPSGNQVWNKRFGDAGQQYAQAVAVDSAGNVLLGGYLGGTTDFGGGMITVPAETAFVVKLLP